MRECAVQRRKLLSKIRFWKSKSITIDLRKRRILELNITPMTPCRAAPTLLPRLRDDDGVIEGCMLWENQIDTLKINPTRQTMTAKPSSILKSIVKFLYPQFFPIIGMSYWFINS